MRLVRNDASQGSVGYDLLCDGERLHGDIPKIIQREGEGDITSCH